MTPPLSCLTGGILSINFISVLKRSNVNNIHFVKDYFSTAFIRGRHKGEGGLKHFSYFYRGTQVKLGFWVGIGTLGGGDLFKVGL